VKLALLIIGPACELLGIVFVGWPDLSPATARLAGRIASWFSRTYRSLVDRLRRLFHRPRHHVFAAGVGTVIAKGGGVSGVTSIDASATLERKIEYLLGRDQQVQSDVDGLRAAIAGARAELSKTAAELRAELVAHVAAELKRSEERYRPLRLTGIALLAAGLLMVSVGAFLP
jgi:hypothetical protein